MSPLLPKMRSLRCLAEDRRGVSALEFALIAPLMLMLLVGVAETGNFLTIYRRTLNVASTTADLAAQVKTITKSDIQDIFSASKSILTPYDTTPLKIVLSSVVADASNKTTVEWSCASNGSASSGAFSVPPGLTEAGSSVIVATITYDFAPTVLPQFFGLSLGSKKIERTFYTRPRRSAKVSKTDGTGC